MVHVAIEKFYSLLGWGERREKGGRVVNIIE